MVQTRGIIERLNRTGRKDSDLSRYFELEELCKIQRAQLSPNTSLASQRIEYCIRR